MIQKIINYIKRKKVKSETKDLLSRINNLKYKKGDHIFTKRESVLIHGLIEEKVLRSEDFMYLKVNLFVLKGLGK